MGSRWAVRLAPPRGGEPSPRHPGTFRRGHALLVFTQLGTPNLLAAYSAPRRTTDSRPGAFSAYTCTAILPQTAGLRVARSYRCHGLARGGSGITRPCLSSSGGHDGIDPPHAGRVSRRPSTPWHRPPHRPGVLREGRCALCLHCAAHRPGVLPGGTCGQVCPAGRAGVRPRSVGRCVLRDRCFRPKVPRCWRGETGLT